MGFGVWGLGFGVWGLGFGVWGLGFGVWGPSPFQVWGMLSMQKRARDMQHLDHTLDSKLSTPNKPPTLSNRFSLNPKP